MYSIITDWPRYPPNLSAPKSMTPRSYYWRVYYISVYCICLYSVCVFGSAKDFPFTFYTVSKLTSLLLNEGSPPHCFFFCPWHRWLGVSHRWSSYMIKYICWAKRLQMKIFIFGFTYVPKVKGQPCLHFSSEHIFSILYHCLFVFWLNYLPQCI